MEMEIDLRTVDGNKKKTPSQQSNSARFDNEGKWPWLRADEWRRCGLICCSLGFMLFDFLAHEHKCTGTVNGSMKNCQTWKRDDD